MKSITFKLDHDGDDVVLVFDYDLQFIEDLKTVIPHTRRSFDPVRKEWTVPRENLAGLVCLSKDVFDSVIVRTMEWDGTEEILNVTTGARTVQGSLFGIHEEGETS